MYKGMLWIELYVTSNQLKAWKLSGHMPWKRIDLSDPLQDAALKMFKWSFLNCSVSSKRKSNLKRHMTNQKSNLKRHMTTW